MKISSHILFIRKPVFIPIRIIMEKGKYKLNQEINFESIINSSLASYIKLLLGDTPIGYLNSRRIRYPIKKGRFIKAIDLFELGPDDLNEEDNEEIYGMELEYWPERPENLVRRQISNGEYRIISQRKSGSFRFTLNGQAFFTYYNNLYYPYWYDFEQEEITEIVISQGKLDYVPDISYMPASFNKNSYYELIDYALCELNRSYPKKLPSYRKFEKDFYERAINNETDN